MNLLNFYKFITTVSCFKSCQKSLRCLQSAVSRADSAAAACYIAFFTCFAQRARHRIRSELVNEVEEEGLKLVAMNLRQDR